MRRIVNFFGFGKKAPQGKPVPKRFEQWDREKLHAKLKAAGWVRNGRKPFGPRSWVPPNPYQPPRSTRNAATIEGLIS